MGYELDYLNRQYQELEKKIEDYQSEQEDIRQKIKHIEHLANDKKAIAQAFLDKHPNVIYDDKNFLNFTVDPDENVHLARTYIGREDEPPLRHVLKEFEQYMKLLPYVQKNPNLKGNIVADLHNTVTYTDQYITFGADNTITIVTKYDCDIRNHTEVKDGVTIKYNDYPPRPDYGWGQDEPSDYTRLDFELETSYDLSDDLENLPQILDDLAERVAAVRKATIGR